MIWETFAKKLSISNERKTAIERKDWYKKREGNLEIIKTRSEKCEEKIEDNVYTMNGLYETWMKQWSLQVCGVSAM